MASRFDIAVAFGVEIGSSRSLSNRLASAVVAADEARADGLRWKYHDPETLKDAYWRLSMLSQLDDAIDKGQVWVAYQPQARPCLAHNHRGAEALARWTHPEKGPIAAIRIRRRRRAERPDRASSRDFVLDQAIAAAARIKREAAQFRNGGEPVGALARRSRRYPARVGNARSAQGSTAAPADPGADRNRGPRQQRRHRRDLFVAEGSGRPISIDDYGTGLSTLDYLKKIPASEIKIDQSFVKAMLDNRSDLVMVQSTIGLAHSLGRTVVAEGVERREILDMLIEMKCDVAQGFIIGRP